MKSLAREYTHRELSNVHVATFLHACPVAFGDAISRDGLGNAILAIPIALMYRHLPISLGNYSTHS